MVAVPVITAVASGAAAYGGAWGAVRVELRWMQKELERHDRELHALRMQVASR
jgi:hypothetical protein